MAHFLKRHIKAQSGHIRQKFSLNKAWVSIKIASTEFETWKLEIYKFSF